MNEDCRQGRAHGRVLGRIIFTWGQKWGVLPNVRWCLVIDGVL